MEEEDDLGSGWLQVKKKHRSSSRFSLQGWVGGLSGKHNSNPPHSQGLSVGKGQNSQGKFGNNTSRVRGNFSNRGQRPTVAFSSAPHKEKVVHCLDKRVVIQDSRGVDSPSTKLDDIAEVKNVLVKDNNPTPCQKIKWGDLDEEELSKHINSPVGTEPRLGDTTNCKNVAGKAEDDGTVVSCISLGVDVTRNKEVVASVGDEHIQDSRGVDSPSTKLDDVAEVKNILVNDSNSTPCQKIKWGDLDEEELSQHINSPVGTEPWLGDTKNCKHVAGKAEDDGTVVSCISLDVDVTRDKEVVASVDSEHILSRSSSFAFGGEDNRDDVDEVAIEDVKVEIASGEMSDVDFTITKGGETSNEQKKVGNIDLPSPVSLSAYADLEKDELIMELAEARVRQEGRSSKEPEAPLTVTPPNKTGDLMVEASSLESSRNQQAEKTSTGLSSTEVRSGNDPEGSGESKERFRQRLWCFLFENLNRAVDELYLLCELECDTEQMNEAVLVLKEAASDFKELKSRVEKFENVKTSATQVMDVSPVTMKSDHRRRHALSWEVRRMTTSPHKAEILSSSLEAFRKIQQERAKMHAASDAEKMEIGSPTHDQITSDDAEKYSGRTRVGSRELTTKTRIQNESLDTHRDNLNRERRNSDSGRSSKINSTQKSHLLSQNPSVKVSVKERSVAASITHKIKREQMGSSSETERVLPKKEKVLTRNSIDNLPKPVDQLKKQNAIPDTDRDKKLEPSWKTMDAWKEKRNWEDILSSPCRGSSRYSNSPGINRKSAERARNLHDKLMSPEKKKKTASDYEREREEKHARARRIRNEQDNEKMQKLQRSSEKLTRVTELQAEKSMKLRDEMYERHQRSESRHEAYLAQVVKRAGDESTKVNEVRFITSLNDENRKLILRQKFQDSELRIAERRQVKISKQKEDIAREEAVLERKKLLAAEKLQRLAEIQRRKEEAQLRREEERKASSAAREARAIEQMRRKEIRVKAQQEEAELLAQKLAERLKESEQRRKFYLEQIRERASMDFRDQSSPFLRRSGNKDNQGRPTLTGSGEECEGNSTEIGGSSLRTGNVALQHSLKRRIKRIRQKLMALKYEFSENPLGVENGGIGYRAAVGTARSKVGRWLQELQKFRQARKEGAAGIGLITAEMIKFLGGKEPELQAARQAGLLDFIASALPASHTSKPEAYQVTIYLLRLLKVVLSLPANRSYFIAQNLLPPIIPMLAVTLENYIKIAASSNISGSSNLLGSKTSVGNLESISEALDGFLWTVTTIIGHISSDERQLQMQDGLSELVLAHQVIHRLRDLFALYDRPQVEGSPFPSSIHLSINLLAILTSRSREISSIAWEYLVIENKTEVDLPNDISASLPEVPEGRGIESYVEERNKESVVNDKIYEGSTVTPDSNTINDSQNVLADDTLKPCAPRKDEKDPVDDNAEQKNDNRSQLKSSVKLLLSAVSETGLVCLPSLLTAVLLQANNRLSSESAPHVLPSNFEEVATGVLKVLNNLASIDISFMQKMLARPDLKMELFHLMSFLLSHCTSKWRVATDQVGLLLLESLLLLGYFSLFHPANQAVLRWGKSPTILHKVCDLPFVFFSDPELMPVLAGTLVAACYGCEQNKGVVQQELSTDMLLSLLKSCRNSAPIVRSSSSPDNPSIVFPNENNQAGVDSRKVQTDMITKSSRHNLRSSRVSGTKPVASVNGNGSNRSSKIRNQRDNKTLKFNEEISVKQYQSPPGASSSALMLHSRFSESFIDTVEQFFAAETTISGDEA